MFTTNTIILLVALQFLLNLNIANGREHNCCENAFLEETKCIKNGKSIEVDLQCSYGQYFVDPERDPIDAFTIIGGNLHFTEVNVDVPFSSYCTGFAENKYKNGTKNVAVICFDEYNTDRLFFLIKGILAFISVGFLCLTLGVYWMIPSLRDTQDKVTIFCLASLTTVFTFLGVLQMYTGEKDDISCHVLAFITYFFTLAYFAWLNMISANILKISLLRQWKISERLWYTLNHIYAWFIPILCTLILGVNHYLDTELGPGIGHNSCWVKGTTAVWLYIYTPMTLMIFFNIVCFSLSCWGLYKIWGAISNERRRSLKYKCQLYFKLFMLCGLTWIFEIISFALKKYKWYWLITDCINALHGLFIFLILVVFRKRVRRELGGKKVCCFPIAREWAKVVPSENFVSTETQDISMQVKHHT